MATERDERSPVTKEDGMISFKDSGYVHMLATIRAPGSEDRRIPGLIAGLSQMILTFLTTGAIFEYVNISMQIRYSGLSDKLRKFDSMRLIKFYLMVGNGRRREIVLRYDPITVARAYLG